MTVIELKNELDKMIARGQGNKPVSYPNNSQPDDSSNEACVSGHFPDSIIITEAVVFGDRLELF